MTVLQPARLFGCSWCVWRGDVTRGCGMRSRFDADVQTNSGDTLDSCAHKSVACLGPPKSYAPSLLLICHLVLSLGLGCLWWSCAGGSGCASGSHIPCAAIAHVAESRNSSPFAGGIVWLCAVVERSDVTRCSGRPRPSVGSWCAPLSLWRGSCKTLTLGKSTDERHSCDMALANENMIGTCAQTRRDMLSRR
jgi:hypothetical protein